MDRMHADSPSRLQPTTCLFAARALRDFGDGFVAVLLPFYLLALGLSPLEVGIVATTSLFGSACLTIGAGLLGARYGHRQLLLGAASLMIATGVAFALVNDYALLLVVTVRGVGVIQSGKLQSKLHVKLHFAFAGVVLRLCAQHLPDLSVGPVGLL